MIEARPGKGHSRRLTLGDVGGWIKIRQEPGRSTTLGDVGAWFKNKLPGNRPERGGTLRKNQWENEEQMAKKSSEALKEGSQDIPTSTGHTSRHRRHLTDSHHLNRRGGMRASDQITDWNTPKNISEALPDPSLPGEKAPAGHDISTDGHKESRTPLGHMNSLSVGKISRGMESGDVGTMESKQTPESAPILESHTSAVSAKKPPILLLEDMEAREKARKLRRSLKESGDWLGVQGCNPRTGVPDASSSESGGEIMRVVRELQGLSEMDVSEATRQEIESHIEQIAQQQHDKRSQRLAEQQQATASVTGRWRRKTHQWLSAQEPILSPIAQSQRSESIFSKPRQLHINRGMAEQQELVDLGTPNGPSPSRERLKTRESPQRSFSDSSDTVVRTPHRQHLGDLSPTALELFENGIIFDEPVEPGRNDGSPLRSHPNRPLHLTERLGGFSETKNPRGDKAATIANDAQTNEQQQQKRQKRVVMPFLGRGPQAEADSGGVQEVPKPRSSASLPGLSKIIKPLPLNHSFSLASSKSMLDEFIHRKNPLPQSPVRGSTTNHHKKSATLQTRSNPIGHNSLAENQLHPNLGSLYQQENLERMQRLDWIPESTTRGEIGFLDYDESTKTSDSDLLSNPQTPKREEVVGTGLRNQLLTMEEIQADVKTLRERLALVDQPSLTTLKNKDDNNGTRTWAQDAMRDITNKGNEVKRTCASTPITTTTGYAQTTSTSHPKPSCDSQTGLQQKRKVTRATHNLRSLGTTPGALEISQDSRGRSTWPRSGSVTETRAIDTISRRQERTERHSELPPETCVSNKELEPTSEVPTASLQCNNLSTSTSTMGLGDVGNTTVGDTLQEDTACKSPEYLLRQRLGHGTETNNQIMDLAVHVPGSFPSRLNAEDGIADPSSNGYGQDERRGLWDAIKEVSNAVKGCCIWVLKLYWRAVQPVFDSRSEYWVRTGQDNNWKDLGRFALAFPLIFSMVVLMVWIMEFTTIMKRCMNEYEGERMECLVVGTLAMLRRSLTGE
ncbi:hypothetical protein CEP52_008401 [Fusarium oligoseptatum]|uniref:Uncharacterized protein n=1 Tax=Fusarium oligoseptatum TaxID=2604345 RepID=A0A428TI29_9HYPO|nr:hypothetical protein CEP52_008401 [Fusarium oligoseptatum]